MVVSMFSTKLFVGCHIPPDLRIQLNRSLAWKRSRVAPEPMDPVDILHEGRHYLGYFIHGEQSSLTEVREIAPRVCDAVRRYCHAYPIDEVSIYVFPQVFVS
jgi:hypothetical protein